MNSSLYFSLSNDQQTFCIFTKADMLNFCTCNGKHQLHKLHVNLQYCQICGNSNLGLINIRTTNNINWTKSFQNILSMCENSLFYVQRNNNLLLEDRVSARSPSFVILKNSRRKFLNSSSPPKIFLPSSHCSTFLVILCLPRCFG